MLLLPIQNACSTDESRARLATIQQSTLQDVKHPAPYHAMCLAAMVSGPGPRILEERTYILSGAFRQITSPRSGAHVLSLCSMGSGLYPLTLGARFKNLLVSVGSYKGDIGAMANKKSACHPLALLTLGEIGGMQ